MFWKKAYKYSELSGGSWCKIVNSDWLNFSELLFCITNLNIHSLIGLILLSNTTFYVEIPKEKGNLKRWNSCLPDFRFIQILWHKWPEANSALLFILLTQPASVHWVSYTELDGTARPRKNMTYHLAWLPFIRPQRASVAASNMAAPKKYQLIFICVRWLWPEGKLHLSQCRC